MLITTSVDGDTAVISPRGEIDFATLPELLATPRHLPPAVTQIIWDLHGTRFIDIAGLHLLANQRHACLQTHQTLAVTGLSRQAQHLLALAQDVFPDLDFGGFLPPASPATAPVT